MAMTINFFEFLNTEGIHKSVLLKIDLIFSQMDDGFNFKPKMKHEEILNKIQKELADIEDGKMTYSLASFRDTLKKIKNLIILFKDEDTEKIAEIHGSEINFNKAVCKIYNQNAGLTWEDIQEMIKKAQEEEKAEIEQKNEKSDEESSDDGKGLVEVLNPESIPEEIRENSDVFDWIKSQQDPVMNFAREILQTRKDVKEAQEKRDRVLRKNAELQATLREVKRVFEDLGSCSLNNSSNLIGKGLRVVMRSLPDESEVLVESNIKKNNIAEKLDLPRIAYKYGEIPILFLPKFEDSFTTLDSNTQTIVRSKIADLVSNKKVAMQHKKLIISKNGPTKNFLKKTMETRATGKLRIFWKRTKLIFYVFDIGHL